MKKVNSPLTRRLSAAMIQVITVCSILLLIPTVTINANDTYQQTTKNVVYLPIVFNQFSGDRVDVSPEPTTIPKPTALPEPTATPESTVRIEDELDIQNRASSKIYFDTYYDQFVDIPLEWTGNHANCDAGTTSAQSQESFRNLLNYFREMAGVPANVQFDAVLNRKAQASALMMSVNRQLSHSPSKDWLCYSAEGAEASGKSNLSLWYGYGNNYHGILGQMQDDGAGNYAVGHRRWILHPQTTLMGIGTVPQGENAHASNTLWVINGGSTSARPTTRDGYVAWPPAGYVPYPLIYDRWSFSYPSADFSATTITMSVDGNAVTNLKIEPLQNGYGENTIVWIPTYDERTDRDVSFSVRLNNVKINGKMNNFEYELIGFAP